MARRELSKGMKLVGGSLAVEAGMLLPGYSAMARLQYLRGKSAAAHDTLEQYLELATCGRRHRQHQHRVH